MKKVLLAFMALAISVAVNAQVWIGGSLGFWSNSDAEEYGSSVETKSLYNVLLEAGYNLSEEWAIAIGLEYGYHKFGDFHGTSLEATHSYSFAPYARYNFIRKDKFKLFLDGGVEITSLGSDEQEYTIWNVGIKPGLSYSLTEKFSLVAHMGFLGYQKVDDDLLGGSLIYRNGFGFDFDNNVSFGVYYSF